MKKILVITHFAGSPVHGMVLRNYLLASEWVKQGHEVTLITSNYSHFRTNQPKRSWRPSYDIIEGIKYVWLPGVKYKARSALGRVVAMAFFVGNVYCWWWANRRKQHFDIVVASSP